MRIHVDQEVVFMGFGLPRGMRKNIPRIGLHRNFLQFFELLRKSLEHRASPG
jgi:hypothetical protein